MKEMDRDKLSMGDQSSLLLVKLAKSLMSGSFITSLDPTSSLGLTNNEGEETDQKPLHDLKFKRAYNKRISFTTNISVIMMCVYLLLLGCRHLSLACQD
jgi:hypothetical protein